MTAQITSSSRPPPWHALLVTRARHLRPLRGSWACVGRGNTTDLMGRRSWCGFWRGLFAYVSGSTGRGAAATPVEFRATGGRGSSSRQGWWFWLVRASPGQACRCLGWNHATSDNHPTVTSSEHSAMHCIAFSLGTSDRPRPRAATSHATTGPPGRGFTAGIRPTNLPVEWSATKNEVEDRPRGPRQLDSHHLGRQDLPDPGEQGLAPRRTRRARSTRSREKDDSQPDLSLARMGRFSGRRT